MTGYLSLLTVLPITKIRYGVYSSISRTAVGTTGPSDDGTPALRWLMYYVPCNYYGTTCSRPGLNPAAVPSIRTLDRWNRG